MGKSKYEDSLDRMERINRISTARSAHFIDFLHQFIAFHPLDLLPSCPKNLLRFYNSILLSRQLAHKWRLRRRLKGYNIFTISEQAKQPDYFTAFRVFSP